MKVLDNFAFSQNVNRTLADLIVLFVRLVSDGMIRNALTYSDIFFRSNLDKRKTIVGLMTGTFVQKYLSGSSSIQLKVTSLVVLTTVSVLAGRAQKHNKPSRDSLNCQKDFIIFISIFQ